MAYLTGTVSDIAALLTVIRNACTANGWTLSGNILHRDGCQVALTSDANGIRIQGGTGVSGTTLLGPQTAGEQRIGTSNATAPLSFPLTYHVHVLEEPNEVFVFVNYNVTRWQWLAFGRSLLSLPGNGTWYGATLSGPTNISFSGAVGANNQNNANRTSACLFWCGGTLDNNINCSIHHNLDSLGWSRSGNQGASGDGAPNTLGPINEAHAIRASSHLLGTLPSSLNAATVLIPCNVYLTRSESKTSLVAPLQHCRYTRNDNLEDGEVVELGPERWKVYPFHQKNAASRDSWNSVTHTGTAALAVRYDGD